jgi:methyl-accepting chemotaxis protein
MLKTVLSVVICLNTIIFTVYMLDRHFGLPGTIFNVFSISLLLMEVSAVGIVAWIGRDISFHIAGPVYAIHRTLKGMAKGDMTQRLRLRDGDNFTDAADTLNSVLETYQNRIARLQALAAKGTMTEQLQQELQEELRWFVTEKEESAPDTSQASKDTVINPPEWHRQSA